MYPRIDDLLQPAKRRQELSAGVAILGAAILLGYLGSRGILMYLRGSRGLPANPVACAIGLGAGILGGYLGLRLLAGWRRDKALLPLLFLFLGGVASLAGGVWFIMLSRTDLASAVEIVWYGYLFGIVGVSALILWWRRVRKQPLS